MVEGESPLGFDLEAASDELALMLALLAEQRSPSLIVRAAAERYGRDTRTVERWLEKGRAMLLLLRARGFMA